MTTYVDGYGGTVNTAADTTLINTAVTNNQGARTFLVNGTGSRALLRFNLSAIPATATCTSATLSVFQAAQATASAFTLTAYSVASANSAWIEGTANNAQAASGEPCWNALAADGSGGVTTAWAGTVGCATSGTDFEATAMGTANGNRSDDNGTEYSISLNTTRTAGWFGTANTNYGLLLIASAACGQIASSDHGTTSYRPKLTVVYTDNTSPTVALSTADSMTTSDTTPTLEFTGTDANTDSVRYNIQISMVSDFPASGSNLEDSFTSGGGGLTMHPEAIGGTTWEDRTQLDDRPGQSFTAQGGVLDKVSFYLVNDKSNASYPNGTAYIRVYSHTGTYGTSSAPTDDHAFGDTPTDGWLAESDGLAFTSAMSTDAAWYDFAFSGANRIRLTPGTKYVAILEWVPSDTDSDNSFGMRGDANNTGSLHGGNVYNDGGNENNNGVQADWDIYFRVYESNTLLDKTSGTHDGFANTTDGADTDPFDSGDLASFTVQAGDALAAGTYYWRVRAIDPDGSNTYGNWTAARSFTVTTAVNPAGIANGTSTAAVALSASKYPAAVANGAGSLAVALTVTEGVVEQNPAGVSDGTGSAAVALAITRYPAATANGTGTATATLLAAKQVSARADGAGTAASALQASKRPAARADGTGAAIVSIAAGKRLAATANGAGTATSALRVGSAMEATANGTSSAVVSLAARRQLAARADGTSSATAQATNSKRPQATANGTSAATAALSIPSGMLARAEGTSSAIVNLTARRALRAQTDGTSTAEARIGAGQRVAGTADGASSVTGGLTVNRFAAATASGTGSAAASLHRVKGVAGGASGQATASVVKLVARRSAGGTAAGTSTASAYLEVGVVRLQLGESLTPAGTMHAGQQLMTPAGSMRRVREVA